MTAELERLARAAQDERALVHGDAHPARVELVARRARAIRDIDPQALAGKLDALIVGGMARLKQERTRKEQHLEAGERQDEPRAEKREAGADREDRDRERGKYAGEARWRNRAIALEGQAKAALVFPERQLSPHICPRRLEARHAHRGA